jgi:hypothetical protein
MSTVGILIGQGLQKLRAFIRHMISKSMLLLTTTITMDSVRKDSNNTMFGRKIKHTVQISNKISLTAELERWNH